MCTTTNCICLPHHDDVIKWKRFPRYWPFVSGIHRSPVDSHHKGQWHGALMFSLICPWTNGWANIRDGGDLRRHCAHYDVTVMTAQTTFIYIKDPGDCCIISDSLRPILNSNHTKSCTFKTLMAFVNSLWNFEGEHRYHTLCESSKRFGI